MRQVNNEACARPITSLDNLSMDRLLLHEHNECSDTEHVNNVIEDNTNKHRKEGLCNDGNTYNNDDMVITDNDVVTETCDNDDVMAAWSQSMESVFLKSMLGKLDSFNRALEENTNSLMEIANERTNSLSNHDK